MMRMNRDQVLPELAIYALSDDTLKSAIILLSDHKHYCARIKNRDFGNR